MPGRADVRPRDVPRAGERGGRLDDPRGRCVHPGRLAGRHGRRWDRERVGQLPDQAQPRPARRGRRRGRRRLRQLPARGERQPGNDRRGGDAERRGRRVRSAADDRRRHDPEVLRLQRPAGGHDDRRDVGRRRRHLPAHGGRQRGVADRPGHARQGHRRDRGHRGLEHARPLHRGHRRRDGQRVLRLRLLRLRQLRRPADRLPQRRDRALSMATASTCSPPTTSCRSGWPGRSRSGSPPTRRRTASPARRATRAGRPPSSSRTPASWRPARSACGPSSRRTGCATS